MFVVGVDVWGTERETDIQSDEEGGRERGRTGVQEEVQS